jgi:hypothetical protein
VKLLFSLDSELLRYDLVGERSESVYVSIALVYTISAICVAASEFIPWSAAANAAAAAAFAALVLFLVLIG